MSFGKTLLAGAALCALATAPALASAPSFHLAGTTARAITMHNGSMHSKTDVRDPGYTNFTETVTFAGTISETGFYKNPVLVWAEVWLYSSCGTAVPNEKGKVAKKAAHGKVAAGTSTGTATGCTNGTVYTFIGPVYTLKSKTATSDSFTFDLDAKAPGIKYKLKLVGNTNLTIGHP
jgi:hypothetical protein